MTICMSHENSVSSSVEKTNFLVEAWRELGRKVTRFKLRRETSRHENDRRTALIRLGRHGWEAGVDLSEFPELRSQIENLDTRMGELRTANSQLEAEKAKLEEQRRAEVGRFDARIRVVEEARRPVDDSLRNLTQKRDAAQREVQRLESRLAALSSELADLEKRAAAARESGELAQVQAAEARRQTIVEQQSELSAALPEARERSQSSLPEIERLKVESEKHAAEIATIVSERKAKLNEIDSKLGQLRKELVATGRQEATVSQERVRALEQLGLGLYEKRRTDPVLTEPVRQVAEIDSKLTACAASLNHSLAVTKAMPRATMFKFAATVVAVPLLLILATYGLYRGIDYLLSEEEPPIVAEEVNPYLQHPLSGHPAYQLADQLVHAQSEEDVAELMRRAFQKIHLGIYTPQGKQLLAGAERNAKDFFLYDFQWKIMARAFYQRNGMRFSNHSRMLGKGLLEMEQPEYMEGLLADAVARRYREAVAKPDEPMSFLILLVDGLARHQIQPYSLDESGRFSGEHIFLDPLQSFLIMLDFFTRPPSAGPIAWLPSLSMTAYADGPCDLIKGDEGQGYWGRGSDILTELGQNLPGAAGKILGGIGQSTGITGVIGDLLVLYGMTIELHPEPYVIHLIHDDDYLAFIQAVVKFDAQGIPDEVLQCGWLAGKQMPSEGPMKDVELTWDFRPELPPHLEMASEMWHGLGDSRTRLTGTAAGLRTTTNEAGRSSFLIQPKTCPARRGRVVGQDYMAIVTARYVTKSMPTPGLLGWGLLLKLGPGAVEYLMNGRTAYVRFRAEWHEDKPEESQY